MGAMLPSRIWTQQPQVACCISPKWASLVVVATTPNFSISGSGQSVGIIKATNYVKTFGKHGGEIAISSIISGPATQYLNPEKIQSSGTADRSYLVIYKRLSGSSTAPVIFGEEAASSYIRNAFMYDGGWVWSTRDTSTGDTGTRENLALTSPVSGEYENRLFVLGSGKKVAYLNGKLDAQTSTSVTAFTSTTSTSLSLNGLVGNSNAQYGSDSRIALFVIFNRALSAQEANDLYVNPWQIFAPIRSNVFVSLSGGSDATGSGSFASVSIGAPSASATASASASGSLAAITISSPTATASAGGSATASGSFAALSISPATATATATKSATASGAFATISLSAPTATATGTTAGGANATGTPAQITISHATAIAIGSAVASGGYQSIGITAPTGSASVGSGNATASGALSAISITAPAAYASSGFIRAPSGSGPTVIQPGRIRPPQSATSRPSNTGGRRH